jgi:restriction system protein
VALGWPEVGNIREWGPTREEFRSQFEKLHGYNATPRGISAAAGMLFNFVHVMRVGDLVVSPSPLGGVVRIGRITSEYEYKPETWVDYPSMRCVGWIAEIPRGDLSGDVRKSLKSQRSLFRVRAGERDLRRLASEHTSV